MTTRWLVLAPVLAMVVSAPVAADETTFCNAYITSLPYTISTQGHYCFDRNLSTGMTAGNAITINADFVVLDLNNFKLGGGSAGLATDAVGIYSTNHNNITVRNGNIRGFAYAIKIYGSPVTSSQNNLIENNTIDGNTIMGVWLHGVGNTVRNNVVTNTGGSTASPHPYLGCTMAINTRFGEVGLATEPVAHVIGNAVGNTTASSGGGNCIYSIAASAFTGSIAMGNIVSATATALNAKILATICKDNIVYQTAGTAYNCNSLVGSTNFP